MNQPAKPKAYPLESIVLDNELQLREGVVQTAIDEYCQVIKDGGKLPPISCVQVDGELLLVDGFARYYAHEKALKTRIYVQILPGQNRKDAIKYACGANSKHGVPRSNEDRRKATLKALATWPQLSERKIADICGVSRSFVHKLMPKQDDAVEAVEEASEKPSKPAAAKPSSKPAGAPIASEPQYKEMDCPVCLGVQFVLSDGGWKCCNCQALEADFAEPVVAEPAEEPSKPVDEPQAQPSFDAAKLEIDQADWKKWLTVFGQLTRATHKCGLYVALQTDLAALKKKAMDLAQ